MIVALFIAAWLLINVLAVAALVRHGNRPSTIRRRQLRQLERLWVLSPQAMGDRA